MRDQGQLALKVDTKGLKQTDGSYLELWLMNPETNSFVSLGPVTPGTTGVHPIPAGVTVKTDPFVDISVEPLDGDPARLHRERAARRVRLTREIFSLPASVAPTSAEVLSNRARSPTVRNATSVAGCAYLEEPPMLKHSVRRMIAVATLAIVPVAAVGISPAGAAAKAESTATNKQKIVAIAASDPQFSTLVTAVKKAGLVKTLNGKGPFTVFAPTNDAFAKIPADTLNGLLADKEALAGVLTYHVLSGKVPSSKLQPTQTVNTVQGDPITIDVANGEATITDGQGTVSKIVKTDIKAKNGVIHVIDTVLLPPESMTPTS